MKNLITSITLMAVLVMGAISVNAGILVSDRSACTTKQDGGIILSDYTGIIVAGLTGIIVAGRDGIIVAGRDGIIVAGKSSDSCQEESRGGIILSD